MDLSSFARLPLGVWPTPLEDCARLGGALGARVLVKRDDVNGLGLGGNKLRKLEFLLARAVADGAETIITFGGVQTNHGRQTAAACARLGLRCELVLKRAVPRSGEAYERSGNRALDELYGARVHVCDDAAEVAATHLRLLGEHDRVVTFPLGGSNGLGVLGYVAAADELLGQLGDRDIDHIVVAAGTGGTAAGLALGLALAGRPITVEAACVAHQPTETRANIERLAAAAAELLGVPLPSLDHVVVSDRTLGPGYGVPTDVTWAAIRLFARTEGITLDPVYTGKAAAALVTSVAAGEQVVFMHTGGVPGMFGYAPELIEQAGR